MSDTGGSRNQEMSKERSEIRNVFVRRKKVVQPANENKRENENQPTRLSIMPISEGSGNQDPSRGRPEFKVLPFKHVYVRRGKKPTVQQQNENEQEKENQHSRDRSMLFDASMAPFLASLSNTELLRFVVLMATANNGHPDKNEEAAAGTNHGED